MAGSLPRRSALITGANGGLGRAMARSFGACMDLILTDVAAAPLAAFAESLRDEGHTVYATLPGPLDDESLLHALAAAMATCHGPCVLLHTAGLSPSMANWQAIMNTNLVATARLLRVLEPGLRPGFVAVLVASMAGHLCPEDPELDQLLQSPLEPAFLERLTPAIQRLARTDDPQVLSGLSYGLSKRAVLRLCEQRSVAWGPLAARIVSLSPGTIWTPMGCMEVAANPQAAAVLNATPVGRWGTAMDIAAAARFLASDSASFITGCDLRVDGGVTALLRSSPALPASA